MRPQTLLLFLTGLFLSACAGDVQWRESGPISSNTFTSGGSYLDVERYHTTLYNEPGVQRTSHQRAVERPHTTAYIEFDEQGDFFDRNQLVDALREIPKGPNRLVVFPWIVS